MQCLGLLLGREVKVQYFTGSSFGAFSWIFQDLTSLLWAALLPDRLEFIRLLVIVD